MVISVSARVLATLPFVFHLADLTVWERVDPQASRRWLYRWGKAGLVVPLGGPSEVYANLTVSRYPDWELAIRMVMPTAVMTGLEILRRAGWITQIPYLPTITVSGTQRTYQVKRFNVTVQTPTWFESMAPGVISGEGVALTFLAPAWALADIICHEGWRRCGIDPDDIYWDQVTKNDECDWILACHALGMGHMPMNPDIARRLQLLSW
jgi:hypothetical protein